MTDWKGILLVSAFLLAGQASAHGGHEDVPEGEAISGDPIVSLLSNQRRRRNYNPMHQISDNPRYRMAFYGHT